MLHQPISSSHAPTPSPTRPSPPPPPSSPLPPLPPLPYAPSRAVQVDGQLQRASSHLEREELSEALEELDGALAADDSFAHAYARRGAVRLRERQFEQAFQTLQTLQTVHLLNVSLARYRRYASANSSRRFRRYRRYASANSSRRAARACPMQPDDTASFLDGQPCSTPFWQLKLPQPRFGRR